MRRSVVEITPATVRGQRVVGVFYKLDCGHERYHLPVNPKWLHVGHGIDCQDGRCCEYRKRSW
jgi:hypothetical protein